MNQQETQAGSTQTTADASEQAQQNWITPSFERIPLNEAMGPVLNHLAIDGGNSYS